MNIPEEIKIATEGYRSDQDLVGQFITEACIIDQTAMTRAGALREAYELWNKEQGLKPLSGVRFGKRLLSQFDRLDSGRHRQYLGLKIKSE